MKQRLLATFSFFAALAIAPMAFAAGDNLVVTLAGYAVGAAGLGAAALLAARKRAVESEVADLEKRLAGSEKVVTRLQQERKDSERAVEMKDAALAEVQVQRDQSQDMLRALRLQVERVARIDGLTGVANRQQFGDSLDAEIKRCVRQRKPLSLLLADIDFLEDYIDINGREKGDHTLQRLASCFSETFRRAGDLVARVGPGKFAVILPEADKPTSERFAEKIRRRIYEMCVPFPGSDAADRVTVSVGVTTVQPTRLHERDYVVAMADNALLHAQSSGHNTISVSAHAA